jgi:hypothetical protein
MFAVMAYRSAQKLFDANSGTWKIYTERKERVVYDRVYAPARAPAWAHDRQSLWAAVEAKEKRKDACLAREYEVALPAELDEDQRLLLLEDFITKVFLRCNLVADVCVHAPDVARGDDPRAHHAHIVCPERRIGPDGFGNKDRDMHSRDYLKDMRRRYGVLVNQHLARNGHVARVDHRSLKDQAIAREPDIHLGYKAAAMERRGLKSERGEKRRAIARRNAEKQNDLADLAYQAAAGLSEAEARQYAIECGLEDGDDPDFAEIRDSWGIGQIGPRL